MQRQVTQLRVAGHWGHWGPGEGWELLPGKSLEGFLGVAVFGLKGEPTVRKEGWGL